MRSSTARRGCYEPPSLVPCANSPSITHESAEWRSIHESDTQHGRSITHVLAAFGLASLLALSGIGAWTVMSAFWLSPAVIPSHMRSSPALAAISTNTDESNFPQVHGDCKCDHSSGAVCCCCSHCGCTPTAASAGLIPGISSNESQPATGGNWDIDVGGAGTAGGGFCQCNGGCCCCSSCDCTGPGSKFVNATMIGNCNGVSNCNGDLPARQRRFLSDDVQTLLLAELKRR